MILKKENIYNNTKALFRVRVAYLRIKKKKKMEEKGREQGNP